MRVQAQLLIPFAAVLVFGSAGVSPAQPPARDAADPLPAGAIARFGTSRFRTGAEVRALAYSPDGKRLAAWSSSDTSTVPFTLWDAATGRRLGGQTSGHRMTAFRGFAWGRDGRGLAVFRTDVSDLCVWDFLTDPPAQDERPRFGPGEVGYDVVAIAPDGKRLAALTTAGRPALVVFELKPATSTKELKEMARCDPPPHRHGIVLTFTPDGKRLVGVCAAAPFGEAEMTVVVWNAAGKIVRTFPAPDGMVRFDSGLAASNTTVAFGLVDGNVFLAELATGTGRMIATGHKKKEDEGRGIYAVAITADGKVLASAGLDNVVRLSDVTTGKVLRDLGRHRVNLGPRALVFSPDGARLASGGTDDIIRVWDVAAGGEAVPTGGHTDAVRRAAVAPDGRPVLTYANDDVIRVWDAATGNERRRIPSGHVAQARFSPDGQYVVALAGPRGGPGHALKLWDAATGVDATPRGLVVPATGFQFTPDGKTLLAYGEDKLTAYTWPTGAKQWAADMPKPAAPAVHRVSSLTVAPDGRHFVTVAERVVYQEREGRRIGTFRDGGIDLFETATGRHVRRLVDCDSPPRPGVFGADGLYVHDGSGTLPNDVLRKEATKVAGLCVLDPLTGRLVREFRSPGLPFYFTRADAIARSADGKVLFWATKAEVQVFEIATGTFRTALVGHRDTVWALDTPTDVRRLLSGSADKTALLWDVGFGGKPGGALSADDRKKHWTALTSEDGKVGYGAMTALAADSAGFVALAAAELKPAPAGPTAADLAPVFRDLDAKGFAAREAASAKLNGYGESALALVRAEIERTPSAEVRGRLTRFIEQCEGPASFPERLRAGRAIELLEHLRTPEARAVLAELAGGGPARVTADASGAVKRLGGS